MELLGHTNYAVWRLQDCMAKTPENATGLMEAVWPATIARVAEEVADMQAVADKNGDKITIEPWDYRFYAEKVRKAKYDLDSDEVKQYLQLDKLTEAMLWVAGELFNYTFTPVPEGSVPVFHEDVKVWEVTNKDSGESIGLCRMRGKASVRERGQLPTEATLLSMAKPTYWLLTTLTL
ncbi:M3 family metallopeptidase [Flammeovirgaceae bacterium SG7u.111]|nr:M3 family metallopeptidase [Flammeovirgaceae bacterium SG7u.132]WPO33119.1 M3 family metallopeptidase [Flammeovirgaceae bacterium SG7u.111]